MADNLLLALAGAAKGASDVLVPWFQANHQNDLNKELLNYKTNLESTPVSRAEALTGEKTGLPANEMLKPNELGLLKPTTYLDESGTPHLYRGTLKTSTPNLKTKGVLASNQATPQTVDKLFAAERAKDPLYDPTPMDYQARASQVNTAGGFAGERTRVDIKGALPSNQGNTTVAGAASQVQFAARQLKKLIAEPGSAQRLGLSSSDLSRMVMRSAPQEESLKNANFSDTYIMSLSRLKQRLTSDPTAIDQPAIRKELYDIADELDNSAKPLIDRELSHVESIWGPDGKLPKDWENMKKLERGDNFENIKFKDRADSNAPPGTQPPGTIIGQGRGYKIFKR